MENKIILQSEFVKCFQNATHSNRPIEIKNSTIFKLYFLNDDGDVHRKVMHKDLREGNRKNPSCCYLVSNLRLRDVIVNNT